jgi:hypothetical protein
LKKACPAANRLSNGYLSVRCVVPPGGVAGGEGALVEIHRVQARNVRRNALFLSGPVFREGPLEEW